MKPNSSTSGGGAIKISLVTPNHNYAGFLDAAMRSVLDQDYPNLEYIVMDGGSTDGSVDIIRRHAHKLAHWESQPKRGQYRDISSGLERSTGEVMGWLNSDDMHLPWTLRAVGEIFKTLPEVEWISTLQPGNWDWHGFGLGFNTIDGFSREAFLDGKYFAPSARRLCGIAGGMNCQGYIQQESTFWRRSLWERAGGYVSHECGAAGDFELWTRFYRHAELYGVAIPLAGFRHQDQQQTTQADKYAGACLAALAQYRDACGWRPSSLRHSALRLRNRLTNRWMRRFEYTGKRIVRSRYSHPDAQWIVETHRFV